MHLIRTKERTKLGSSIMHESEHVSSETSIDPKELQDLIARLTNPAHESNGGVVRVKDIAETLEIKESDVIRALQQMRAGQTGTIQSSTPTIAHQENQTRKSKVRPEYLMAYFAVVFVVALVFLFSVMRTREELAPPTAVPSELAAPHSPDVPKELPAPDRNGN